LLRMDSAGTCDARTALIRESALSHRTTPPGGLRQAGAEVAHGGWQICALLSVIDNRWFVTRKLTRLTISNNGRVWDNYGRT
jgi:hypothetical protein